MTCTAGVGTTIIEFGTLSRLTGNLVYEEAAMRALRALWHYRSNIGLGMISHKKSQITIFGLKYEIKNFNDL